MPTSISARIGLGVFAAVALLGLVLLGASGDAPRVRTLKLDEVAAATGVRFPEQAYDVHARVTVRGPAWTAVSFRVQPAQYDQALADNDVHDLQPGLTVLRNGDDLGLQWFPRNAKRVAGMSDHLPDGRLRRVQVMWGKTIHKGQPPNPQICIVIVG